MKTCKTEQEFIKTVAQAAQKACKRYGFYLPSVLIAQACKEVGYAIPAYWDNSGVSALVAENNMVGIKKNLLNSSWVGVGFSVWEGDYLRKLTPEVYEGKSVMITDDFRIYDNPEQSFADYLCFMRWGAYQVGGEPKYYSKIKDIHDPAQLIQTVHSLGYATGTTYASGVMSVINKHDLTRFDDLTGVEPSIYYPAAAQGEKESDMEQRKSPLAVYELLSPNNSGHRQNDVTRITPHCVVGQMQIEDMLYWLALPSTKASANYGIGTDGRIGLGVEEYNRSWCSSSSFNDNRAITIECASNKSDPYAFNDAVYNALIALCVDICKRYGKNRLLWLETKERTDSYTPASGEMLLSVHRWYANKACPGAWLMARMSDLASTVTAKLGGGSEPGTQTIYRVQLGAFKYKKNAKATLKQAKAAGFTDAFITDKCEDGFYRVQVGAYTIYENAVRRAQEVKDAGMDAIIKEYTISA